MLAAITVPLVASSLSACSDHARTRNAAGTPSFPTVTVPAAPPTTPGPTTTILKPPALADALATVRRATVDLGTLLKRADTSLGAVESDVPGVTSAASTGTAGAASTTHTSVPPSIISRDRAAGLKAIQRRLTLLSELSGLVSHTSHLSPEQRAAMTNLLAAHSSSLKSLGNAITNDSNIDTMYAHLRSIVFDHRIIVGIEPQVHLIIALDKAADATNELNTLAVGLGPYAIATVMADLSPGYADAKARTGTAANQTVALIDRVVRINPVTWPAAHDILTSSRAATNAVVDGINISAADLSAMIDRIRGVKAGTSPVSTTTGH